MLGKLRVYELEEFLNKGGYSYYTETEKDDNGKDHKITFCIKTVDYNTYNLIFLKDKNDNYRLKFKFTCNVDYMEGLLDTIHVQNKTKDIIKIIAGDNLYLPISKVSNYSLLYTPISRI
jgi:hypothetical protein